MATSNGGGDRATACGVRSLGAGAEFLVPVLPELGAPEARRAAAGFARPDGEVRELPTLRLAVRAGGIPWVPRIRAETAERNDGRSEPELGPACTPVRGWRRDARLYIGRLLGERLVERGGWRPRGPGAAGATLLLAGNLVARKRRAPEPDVVGRPLGEGPGTGAQQAVIRPRLVGHRAG